jgi:hypothetical protein
MKSRFAAVFIIAIACLSGCAHDKYERGNFSNVFVRMIKTYGGKVKKVDNIPAVNAQWTLRSDPNGFECHITGASFSEVNELITEVFALKRTDGYCTNAAVSLRLLNARAIGVALLVADTNECVQINCVRGQSDLKSFLLERNR